MPDQLLNITLVQPQVFWEDKERNLAHFNDLMEKSGETDLIVLPEMFSTGFSMAPKKHAEIMEGDTMKWMLEKAIDHNAVVTGSIIIEDSGSYFNRLVWMPPDGEYEYYDKRHLFSFANEEDHYTAGKRRLIIFLKGWRICPLICYDLRFPGWIRNQDWKSNDSRLVYDLLLFVANWPEARVGAWSNLLEARAHENQCYVAGVNRIGKDGNGINHSGNSALFSPKGELLSDFQSGQEQVKTYTLDHEMITTYRGKFTAWKDTDNLSLFL
ncbi:MAG: amidohydrolase [Salibacteraceae bacterium]